ncbi:MAG TPA: hypothetical protein VKB76_16355, partial [Ktedonobacterales bacterium]|nr:hypothetical protein [Ktedonobacterales bacterium]
MRRTSLSRQSALCVTLAGIVLAISVVVAPAALAAPQGSGRPDAAQHGAKQDEPLAVSGTFTLLASNIVGTNAHLSLLPNPLQPVLSFSSSTIQNLEIADPINSRLTMVFTATQAQTTAVSIQASVFSDLVTALGSFTDKADLLILLAGGIVKQLQMVNVRLTIDRYLKSDNAIQTNFHIALVSPGSVGVAPGAQPTPGATTTPGPGTTATPGPGQTATPSVTGTVGPGTP